MYKLRLEGVYAQDTFDLDTNGILIIDTVYYLDSLYVVNSSFVNHNVFSFMALNEVVYADATNPTVRFHLSDSLWITNMSGQSYEIDWDDGHGFVSFNPNNKYFDITYSAYGKKTIRLKIDNPVPSDTHPYLISTSSFRLAELRFGPADDTIVLPTTLTSSCEIDTTMGIGEGIASIKYRINGDGKLFQPVIIVEGIEVRHPASAVNDKPMRGGFGDLNWAGLSSGDIPGYLQLALFPNLIDSLRKTGYDIVLVDFRTNRAPIQQNANLVINLIQWVNEQLAENNSPHQSIVIGASMGGLISRYAIRKMELENCCSKVRVHATFSTPHRGANVPIGIQSFLYELAYGSQLTSSNKAAKRSYDLVLNSPAARQLLIYHRDPTAAADRAAFQTELDSMGHPIYTRNLALTNGSQNGTLYPMPQGDTLISMHLKIWHPTSPDIGLIQTYFASIAALWHASGERFDSTSTWTLMSLAGLSVSEQSSAGAQNIVRGSRPIGANVSAYVNHAGLAMTGAGIILGLKTAYLMALVSVPLPTCPVACPMITAFYVMAKEWATQEFENLLHNSWQNNENANGIQSGGTYPTSYSISYPTLSYDNAPGDLNDFQRTVANLSGGLAKAKYDASTF